MSTPSAVELLTEFSGKDAKRLAPYFQFSPGSKVVAVEIHAVGTETTSARYSVRDKIWNEVNNILRITTADGFEGISGVGSSDQGRFSDEHFLAMQKVGSQLGKIQSLDPVDVGATIEQAFPDLSDGVRAGIDIALWDLAARRVGCPLSDLLGSKRDSIESYASLPFYDSHSQHIEAVKHYASLGFTTFKFHGWGTIEEDEKLVKRVKQEFANSGFKFMMDVEGAYCLEAALRLGEIMSEGLFVWLEGPVDDERMDDYAELRGKLAIPIIPAGYDDYSAGFLKKGIERKAWDAGRFDVITVGGVSRALELLTIANRADLPMEIQSWGHSLAQAANLHVMLANRRTQYFEAPMPKDAYDFGMKEGVLLDQGSALLPDGPGLGLSVDWEQLATADFYVHSRLDL